MFGSHSFVNLSSKFRELVLESECQVFVKGKHQVLVFVNWVPDSVCASGVPQVLHLQRRCSQVPCICKSVLPGTALIKREPQVLGLQSECSQVLYLQHDLQT